MHNEYCKCRACVEFPNLSGKSEGRITLIILDEKNADQLDTVVKLYGGEVNQICVFCSPNLVVCMNTPDSKCLLKTMEKTTA